MHLLPRLMFLCALSPLAAHAVLPGPAGHAVDATLQDTDDVYNQLQRNAWYLPTRDSKVRLYVTEIGRGAPVVFLHGGPGNDFHYIIDALRPHLNDYQFILFDQRGSLMSPVPAEAVSDLSLDMLVDDLETLRVALGQQKLILFGHSFGSELAMAYYHAHPAHVAGLVLTGSLPPFLANGLAGFVKDMRPRQRALRERPAVARAVSAADLPAEKTHDTPQQARTRQRIQALAAINIIDLARWRQVTGGGVNYNQDVDSAIGATLPDDLDIRPTLEAHPVPITVIQGDHDYVDPGASAWKTMAKEGADVRIYVMPQASHYAWIDDPGPFAKALDIGLRRAARTDSEGR